MESLLFLQKGTRPYSLVSLVFLSGTKLLGSDDDNDDDDDTTWDRISSNETLHETLSRQGEPMPTSASSIGCPLQLSCG
jgi:hypothetical protein